MALGAKKILRTTRPCEAKSLQTSFELFIGSICVCTFLSRMDPVVSFCLSVVSETCNVPKTQIWGTSRWNHLICPTQRSFLFFHCKMTHAARCGMMRRTLGHLGRRMRVRILRHEKENSSGLSNTYQGYCFFPWPNGRVSLTKVMFIAGHLPVLGSHESMSVSGPYQTLKGEANDVQAAKLRERGAHPFKEK